MSAWAKSKADDIQRFFKTAASTALPPLRGNKHRALGRAPHGLPRFSGSGRDAMTVQPKARQRSEVGAWCDTSRTTSTSRDRFREAAQLRPAMIAATLSWSAGYAQSCRSMSNGKSPTPSTAYSKRSVNVTSAALRSVPLDPSDPGRRLFASEDRRVASCEVGEAQGPAPEDRLDDLRDGGLFSLAALCEELG